MKLLNKILIIFLLFPVLAIAQPEITKFSIIKNNVHIYSTGKTVYTSKLSGNKDRIYINFINTLPSSGLKQVNSTGLIQEVNFKKVKDTLRISVNLLSKKGYTSVQLPYSNIILVNAIDWTALSPSDDAFYSGLLAYEDKLFSSAKSFFEKSAAMDNSKGKAFLAFHKIRQGRYEEALVLLKDAENEAVLIPDIFAALSQVYKSTGNDSLFSSYKQKFHKATNLNGFAELPLSIDNDSLIINNYPLTHLEQLSNNNDEVLVNEEENKNELDKKFSRLFKDTTAKSADTAGSENSLISDSSLLTNILSYAALLAVGLAGILIYLYLKWRQKQLKTIKNKDFERQLLKAREELKPKKNKEEKGSLIDSTVKEEQSTNSVSENVYNQKDLLKKKAESGKDKEPVTDVKAPVENDNIENTEIQKEESYITKDDVLSSEIKVDSPAKLELAKKLAEEQQRIKQRKLNSLNQITVNSEKLSDIAKKLGIESGSIETKQAYDKLAGDKKQLSELSRKFTVDKR